MLERKLGITHFTAQSDQKKLIEESFSWFATVSWEPEYILKDKSNYGREERRKIWVTTEINEYLNFPHIGQFFKIKCITFYRKPDKKNLYVIAYGITNSKSS